jgi:hypothetical protein
MDFARFHLNDAETFTRSHSGPDTRFGTSREGHQFWFPSAPPGSPRFPTGFLHHRIARHSAACQCDSVSSPLELRREKYARNDRALIPMRSQSASAVSARDPGIEVARGLKPKPRLSVFLFINFSLGELTKRVPIVYEGIVS